MAYADALKEMRVYVNARLLTDKGTEEIVSISELRKGCRIFSSESRGEDVRVLSFSILLNLLAQGLFFYSRPLKTNS